MEQNQIQKELNSSETTCFAPVSTDNAKEEVNGTFTEHEGQSESSSDPSNISASSEELLLGKFKTVDDLSKAYKELQKHQGESSKELGVLRKQISQLNSYKNLADDLNSFQNSLAEVISRDKELYNTPEYLQNPVFKEIYSQALMTFGDNLDTDRLVALLEKYVENRISSYDKAKSAAGETQKVLDSMTYSKNPKNSLTPPRKTLDEMTDEEFKISLRKLI